MYFIFELGLTTAGAGVFWMISEFFFLLIGAFLDLEDTFSDKMKSFLWPCFFDLYQHYPCDQKLFYNTYLSVIILFSLEKREWNQRSVKNELKNNKDLRDGKFVPERTADLCDSHSYSFLK